MKEITVMTKGALIWFMLVFIASMMGWNAFLNLWDPFYYHSVSVVTPKVKCGEFFVEQIDIQRYRICRVEIDRFMVSDVDQTVLLRERVPGGASSIGRTNNVRNSVPVPTKESGRCVIGPVTLLQNVHSHCIDGMHSKQWPEVHFEIVE